MKSEYAVTDKLRQRFCKDMNLPIKVYEEPYFSHMLKLYDWQFNCVEKYERFLDAVNHFKGESSYFEAYDKLKDDVITYFKENPAMQYFTQKEDFNKFVCGNIGFPGRDIYKCTNDGGVFVSIDMIKANFTALHHYNPEIVKNCETYEDFISTFTDVPHFVASKYIRQVVFGNTNPKRQVTYEKYLMDKVLSKFLDSDVNCGEVAYFGTDEIVLKVPSEYLVGTDNQGRKEVDKEYFDMVHSVLDWARGQNINVRGEFFELRAVYDTYYMDVGKSDSPTILGFVKKYLMDKDGMDFKGFDSFVYPMVMRAYQGQEVEEMDRIFFYETKRAMLLEDYHVKVV